MKANGLAGASLLMVGALLACKGIGGSAGPGNGNVKPAPNYTECAPGVNCTTSYDDVTDKTACAKKAVKPPVLSQTWNHRRHYKTANKHLLAEAEMHGTQYPATAREESTTYIINPEKTRMSVQTTCTSENKTLVATTIADISVASNVILVAKKVTASLPLTLPSGKLLTCTASVPAGVMNYAFSGSCLELSKPTFKKATLAPIPNTFEAEAE